MVFNARMCGQSAKPDGARGSACATGSQMVFAIAAIGHERPVTSHNWAPQTRRSDEHRRRGLRHHRIHIYLVDQLQRDDHHPASCIAEFVQLRWRQHFARENGRDRRHHQVPRQERPRQVGRWITKQGGRFEPEIRTGAVGRHVADFPFPDTGTKRMSISALDRFGFPCACVRYRTVRACTGTYTAGRAHFLHRVQ